MERIIDARLKCAPLHDVFHGLWMAHECSTGILEVKMAQQLDSLEHSLIFGIFLDLKKAYNAMNCKHCLKVRAIWTLTRRRCG